MYSRILKVITMWIFAQVSVWSISVIIYRLFHHQLLPMGSRRLEINLHETVCRQMQINELLESLCIKATHWALYYLWFQNISELSELFRVIYTERGEGEYSVIIFNTEILDCCFYTMILCAITRVWSCHPITPCIQADCSTIMEPTQ